MKRLLISMLTLGLVFTGSSLLADELHVTFRGIVDLLDDRGMTPDSRSLVVIPNLMDPARMPLVEQCKPKSPHQAYILYDPTKVELDRAGTGACAWEIQQVRSCADGKEYAGYSLAGCEVRFAGSAGGGVETVRWAVEGVPVRPTDEANLNWLFDMDALTETEQLPLRQGLTDGSPVYENYPIVASRVVLDRGSLSAGYVYRSAAGPVRFGLPEPHPYRAGSSGLEWSVGDGESEGELSLCPLSDPDCAAPVNLEFSSVSSGTAVHLLIVSEQFGTEDECDRFDHTVSHFYAHYALRFKSETFQECSGPEALETPVHGMFTVQSNPQCSPADNQWP